MHRAVQRVNCKMHKWLWYVVASLQSLHATTFGIRAMLQRRNAPWAAGGPIRMAAVPANGDTAELHLRRFLVSIAGSAR